MNDSTLTLPQVKADLETKIDRLDAKIDRVDVKIDGVKADLAAKIDRLDVKIDDRTEQILAAVRETAEMIDARQARRLHAGLEAQRHVLQDKLDTESGTWRLEQTRTHAALDDHVRDDTRHLRPKR